jgi:hypothetical protein
VLAPAASVGLAAEAATEVCPEAYVLSLDPTGEQPMRPD